MTIEDFRKKTRELLWTNGIKEAFEDELNLMLDRLFQLFQKFYQVVRSKNNRKKLLKYYIT